MAKDKDTAADADEPTTRRIRFTETRTTSEAKPKTFEEGKVYELAPESAERWVRRNVAVYVDDDPDAPEPVEPVGDEAETEGFGSPDALPVRRAPYQPYKPNPPGPDPAAAIVLSEDGTEVVGTTADGDPARVRADAAAKKDEAAKAGPRKADAKRGEAKKDEPKPAPAKPADGPFQGEPTREGAKREPAPGPVPTSPNKVDPPTPAPAKDEPKKDEPKPAPAKPAAHPTTGHPTGPAHPGQADKK